VLRAALAILGFRGLVAGDQGRGTHEAARRGRRSWDHARVLLLGVAGWPGRSAARCLHIFSRKSCTRRPGRSIHRVQGVHSGAPG
jgi:hypothetical protein